MKSVNLNDRSLIMATYAVMIPLAIAAITQGRKWIKNRYPCNDLEKQTKIDARLSCILNSLFLVGIFITILIWNIRSRNDLPVDNDQSETEESIQLANSSESESMANIDESQERAIQVGGADYYGQVDPSNNAPDGKGTMKYDNGDVYEGEWVDGMREGKGCMKYNNGDMYDGEWKTDMREGQGEYTWKDGRKYIGEYKADQRDGEGIYRGWRGYSQDYGWVGTYYGISKKNKFEGDGRFEFDNGDQFVGIFSKDKIWTGIYTLKNGSWYSIVEGVRQE